MKKTLYGFLTFLIWIGVLSGCASKSITTSSKNPSNSNKGKTVTLTIGAYSTPQESIDKIIPLFQKEYKQKTGETIKFKESSQGSGSQTTSILNGFEADIAILSVKGDIDKLVKAGLVSDQWTNEQHGGMITDSVDALGVRKGNPKNIQDWTL
jgi:sulfate/thiosulfate transport system substrate-binding protein